MTSSKNSDLSEVVEALRRYLLSRKAETKNYKGPGSISECAGSLQFFGGTALERRHDAGVFVNFHDEEKNSKSLSIGCKAIQSAARVEEFMPISSFDATDTWCPQNPIPGEPPRKVITKVQSFSAYFIC